MTGDASRPKTVAERRFAEAQEELQALDLKQRFEHMYQTNLWSGAESRSGVGSSLAATAGLRRALPRLLETLAVGSLLDLPCGDFHWMREVDLPSIDYTGGDIVAAAVQENRRRYDSERRRFIVVDIIADPLPRSDAVFCRDCLVHFSFANIARTFGNLRRSGSTWLLTTTFPDRPDNRDIIDGDWRPLNLERPPFNLPTPSALINEGCEEEDGAYADKSIGVWRIADLPTELSSE